MEKVLPFCATRPNRYSNITDLRLCEFMLYFSRIILPGSSARGVFAPLPRWLCQLDADVGSQRMASSRRMLWPRSGPSARARRRISSCALLPAASPSAGGSPQRRELPSFPGLTTGSVLKAPGSCVQKVIRFSSLWALVTKYCANAALA